MVDQPALATSSERQAVEGHGRWHVPDACLTAPRNEQAGAAQRPCGVQMNERLRTRVHGRTVHLGSTAEMVFTVGDTLSLVSHTVTLRPADLLATGTPAVVGYARTPP